MKPKEIKELIERKDKYEKLYQRYQTKYNLWCVIGIACLIIIVGFLLRTGYQSVSWCKLESKQEWNIYKEECWNETDNSRSYCNTETIECNWTVYNIFDNSFSGCAPERMIQDCKSKNATFCSYYGPGTIIKKETRNYTMANCSYDTIEKCENKEVDEIEYCDNGYNLEIPPDPYISPDIYEVPTCIKRYKNKLEGKPLSIIKKSEITKEFFETNCNCIDVCVDLECSNRKKCHSYQCPFRENKYFIEKI